VILEIGAVLRSTKENRQGQDAEQDTEKRARDGEPKETFSSGRFIFTLLSQAF
jgi:hypothetical protein